MKRLCPVDTLNSNYTVVALDLEGTLISNAMSQIPRHGLFRFLELCEQHLPQIVLYTAVRSALATSIVKSLAEEGLAPAWFQDITLVEWSGPHKDLGFIQGHQPQRALLVDDQQSYIKPDQHGQWIHIQEFAHPYPQDHELERVWGCLSQRFRLDVIW